MSDTVPTKSTGRLTRTIRSLIAMVILGALLIAWSTFTSRRDVAVVTGPQGQNQRLFLIDAAERPDIATFFKKLSHSQKMAMSRNVGAYDDAPLAKLCGLLLADFDPDARQLLTESLGKVAIAHPEAVAEQLKLKGSFQVLGVSQALRKAGEKAYPFVVKQLAVGDARSNAVAFLVDSGQVTVPTLLPSLEDQSSDVRMAAADALGKLRAREAVDPLVSHFKKAEGDERLGYLTALAAIGDRRTEELMTTAISDPDLPAPHRAQAALGLGRIATPTSVQFLWSFANHPDAQISASAIAGLQHAKDLALRDPSQPPTLRLKVASGITSSLADQMIADGLRDSMRLKDAAEAAKGRPSLVPILLQTLGKTSGDTQGDIADALIGSLITTPTGRTGLATLRGREDLSGLITRRMQPTVD